VTFARLFKHCSGFRSVISICAVVEHPPTHFNFDTSTKHCWWEQHLTERCVTFHSSAFLAHKIKTPQVHKLTGISTQFALAKFRSFCPSRERELELEWRLCRYAPPDLMLNCWSWSSRILRLPPYARTAVGHAAAQEHPPVEVSRQRAEKMERRGGYRWTSSIEYRWENDHFLVSTSAVTVSNQDLLSSSKSRVNPGIRSWKKLLSQWARCQEAVGGIYSTIRKWEAETLQHGLFWQLQSPA
jgi:hypothetical protein